MSDEHGWPDFHDPGGADDAGHHGLEVLISRPLRRLSSFCRAGKTQSISLRRSSVIEKILQKASVPRPGVPTFVIRQPPETFDVAKRGLGRTPS
jgi:hypothetical protein